MRGAGRRGFGRIAAALLCAALSCAAFASAQGLLGGRDVSDATSLEVGTDRPGADLFARSMPGGDVADCQQLCKQTEGCVAFTFDRVDGLQAPVCRIKEAAPPPQSAPCCISGVVGAKPATPVVAPAAPSPPRTATPAATLIRDGFGRCLDLGADGLVRAAGCSGAPSQRAVLQGGALTIGGRLVGPATTSAACAVRQAMTTTRRYVLQICRAPQGPAAMNVEWRDGALAIDAAIGPADPSGPGAALVAGGDATAVFAFAPTTGELRLVGRELCLVTPPDDSGPGAPVILDYCAAPIASLDGGRAAPDARARFEVVR
ncbi:MAG: hypothetical protein KJS97_11050 [Alphaproteobacteria bacterium]|nr:hypothetical protein [Alphaproteobacteria bacterium]